MSVSPTVKNNIPKSFDFLPLRVSFIPSLRIAGFAPALPLPRVIMYENSDRGSKLAKPIPNRKMTATEKHIFKASINMRSVSVYRIRLPNATITKVIEMAIK